jgi:hypothetical protein
VGLQFGDGRLVGGGYEFAVGGNPAARPFIFYSKPSAFNSWVVSVSNVSPGWTTVKYNVYALCLK